MTKYISGFALKRKTIFSSIRNVVFLVTFPFCITAQTDTLFFEGEYNIVVDSIQITGNETTQDFIILRELTFGIGDTLNPHIASYNRERIYSLRIFNEVKLKPYLSDGKNILQIEIEESWYIYPIPFVTLKDRDWEKVSYGVSVSLLNFRGRNETLSGSAAFGYDPSFSFRYFNPNISYNQNLNFQVSLGYSTSTNKSIEAENLYGASFEQKIFSSRVQLGKRFGNYHWAYLKTGFDYIETPFYQQGINASDNNIDKTLVVGASYVYDTRDLTLYAADGIYALLNYEFKGLGIDGINYRVADLEFREYRKIIEKFTAKWRFSVRHTAGETVPYYDYSYIGYSERIRGYFHDGKSEGNDRLLASVELNYPIIQETRINLYWIPLLPNSLLSYRVAVIAGLFGDTGTTRNSGDPLAIKNFNSGYGTGISFLLLPYFIFRLEYAINDNGNTEWIFDLGASF
ncbi:MAG TPA: BamA/TamA family outer membrane protein [Ignavibacteriaceae bacterium]|nr:BamA/TamA family outer membrane protein [Ignavibacteriaceae bacterium]